MLYSIPVSFYVSVSVLYSKSVYVPFYSLYVTNSIPLPVAFYVPYLSHSIPLRVPNSPSSVPYYDGTYPILSSVRVPFYNHNVGFLSELIGRQNSGNSNLYQNGQASA